MMVALVRVLHRVDEADHCGTTAQTKSEDVKGNYHCVPFVASRLAQILSVKKQRITNIVDCREESSPFPN